MENFFCGSLLLFLLLAAAIFNWSIISLVYLAVFLVLQFNLPRRDFRFCSLYMFLWGCGIYSLLIALLQAIFVVIWVIKEGKWSLADSSWVKLIGFLSFQSWRSPTGIFYLVLQVLVGVVCLAWIYQHKLGMVPWRGSCWGNFLSFLAQLGSYIKVVSCFLLPAIQLVVGISHPSWVSLPFFICSCVGLVDWSLTSNFSGLFRWWRSLQLYSCFIILLLYIHQLPVLFPTLLQQIANFIGLYKISVESGWLEICSSLSLIFFYTTLSFVKNDLEEMEFMMSSTESDLTEQLLPARHSFFIRLSRSGERHTNVLVKAAVFRTFTINFFTYGFPLSLVALSFWSFHFASICAFGLLAYVGYIVYAFPSLFRLHRLNSLLLVFILLWAVSTYIFNVAFSILNWKLGKDPEIWELVGLWRYSTPGYFLIAQFGLGFLVAVGNLVNNSVFTYLSNENGHIPNGGSTIEVKEETKVLMVATIAWGLRKCSRAIMLVLIFLIAMKPGFMHAIYMIFFFIYLLGHSISTKIRQALILLCEAHFALLYILQINLISKNLKHEGSLSREILSQLGLLDCDSSWEFLEIALLACYCAIHNNGFDMLFSFSAFVQHTPYPPIGFSVLKAGLNKSVLLSVYCSSSDGDSNSGTSERRIASYLSAVGQKFLAVYRSWGTYIAFLTILVAVYLVRPNYISFGYIFLLLFWIIGRQLVERTKRRLWFPLKAYAILVFIFMYCLSIFPSFQSWLSHVVDLYPNLGYKPDASMLDNIWESLAILIVMQLYSYERRQSKYTEPIDANVLQSGTLGFIRRFLIWHSNKLLFAALFYASISPISAFGFLYLLGLIISSTFPKTSRVPSKSFLVYTGFVVMVEYLFQMWGQQAKMFPGQYHSDLSRFLGLQVFGPGFWGIESSLRGNVLVIAACTLQYNVFHWLDRMPNTDVLIGEWEEPCPLFVTAEDDAVTVHNYDEENILLSQSTSSDKQTTTASYTWQSPTTGRPKPLLSQRDSENSRSVNFSIRYFWGSIKESQKWNKRRILALRNERFEMQKKTLKVYLMFWIENMFNLFGLEINMMVLLLASFALLNVISLLYIGLLAAFVLLDRRIIRRLWSMLVFLFACVLVLEYFSIWKNQFSLNHSSPLETTIHCHDCWKISKLHFQFCQSCWLGLVVDDPRMLMSYFIVFMVACFKQRADRSPSLSGSVTYHQMMSQRKNIFVWKDLSFETKSMWTIFDYLRLYCYCHLLDLVLTLILITGTLEYDTLHLGYLAFALVFFRMRLEILRKRNKIFKFLRIYNFVIIVLSLAYQSPLIGVFNEGKCGTVGYIYEVIGFYKYDYGFRITSRSALVEIIIFMLVSLQSYMFSSPEFEHVSRYLEAEQIGAIVREQEKKASWKNAQLQNIRETEEKKRQRNMQVEKMKSEMLDLQVQLHSMNSPGNCVQVSPETGGLRKRRSASFIMDKDITAGGKESLIPTFNLDGDFRPTHKEELPLKEGKTISGDLMQYLELLGSPVSKNSESPTAEESKRQESEVFSFGEITEIEDPVHHTVAEGKRDCSKGQSKDHPLKSAVQLIGDGVSQVQSLGNQAVTNLATLLNVSHQDGDSSSHSSEEDGRFSEMERSRNAEYVRLDRTSSLQSDKSTMSESVRLQLLRIFRHIWSQMRSNNDIVCYCCFIIVFLWNFSLLSMVYLAALFLYALCVNTGPSYTFWVVMLIYTEFYILVEYFYQIIIQHCGLIIKLTFLQELGFPHHKINSSFVISSLPLFLVYLFTLLQSSITAQDGDWTALSEFSAFKRKMRDNKYVGTYSSWSEKLYKLFQPLKDVLEMMARNCLRYWKSLTHGAESPPYFVQLSMDVGSWPEDGIQPEKIESGTNQLLKIVHSERCKEENPDLCPSASRVNIQSIEKSQENPNVALAVFEVVHAAPLEECVSMDWSKSLTPAADVAKEILNAKRSGFIEEVGFPYPILSVIGGGKREVDLYAYVFGADLAVFFLVAIFYQSVIQNKNYLFLDSGRSNYLLMFICHWESAILSFQPCTLYIFSY
ncbi:piezo-type mechanosensitive ion channel homolog isoform X3 [Amaranthus tricolor]|uniref:piezo-type mechanosensitive ion channel homolog isoform X3 n=1 Tax=Amaranthus tricolor TaxID=29722 RepID=UPI00258D5E2C|nr:piezo-type mechanosensitive ion channel homolog isoform X3 [Amaranthus tricolor]